MSYGSAPDTGTMPLPDPWGPADSVPRSSGVQHMVFHDHIVQGGVVQLSEALAVVDEPRGNASRDTPISHTSAFLFVVTANTSAVGGAGEQVVFDAPIPAWGDVGRTAEAQAFLVLAERVGQVLINFRVRNYDGVFNFLLEHDYLISLLQAAPCAIRKHFPFAPLALELVHDPESISRTDLAISINVEHYESDAMDRLSALELDWWLDAIQAARDRMFIRFER